MPGQSRTLKAEIPKSVNAGGHVKYFDNSGGIRFSLSLDELMAVHEFPKVGLYALICKDGFVVQGQWLEDDQVDVIQELPDTYYAGAELLLARFDGLNFVPEISMGVLQREC